VDAGIHPAPARRARPRRRRVGAGRGRGSDSFPSPLRRAVPRAADGARDRLGFFTRDGSFTWSNVSALGDPLILRTFANSAGLSLLTAAIGASSARSSATPCWGFPEGTVRSAVDAAAGVLAQFGGVMLAFAFIATIGMQGVVTVFLRDAFGIDIFANGTWLYELPGLILPYIYFQIPSWSSRSSPPSPR
jgi:hypothetical protein